MLWDLIVSVSLSSCLSVKIVFTSSIITTGSAIGRTKSGNESIRLASGFCVVGCDVIVRASAEGSVIGIAPTSSGTSVIEFISITSTSVVVLEVSTIGSPVGRDGKSFSFSSLLSELRE